VISSSVDCGEVESSELLKWLKVNGCPRKKCGEFKDTYYGERAGEGERERSVE
jgi:hypothetical protein